MVELVAAEVKKIKVEIDALVKEENSSGGGE